MKYSRNKEKEKYLEEGPISNTGPKIPGILGIGVRSRQQLLRIVDWSSENTEEGKTMPYDMEQQAGVSH